MAEKRTIQSIYAQLEKEFKLPSFETLNADFDIDTVDPESKHPLKEITKKIFERIEIFKKILETMLQPDVSVLSMQETEFLTEADNEVITDLLRRLMRLDRTLLIGELENKDALYADFINEAVKEWPKVKKDLAPIIKHLQLGWSTRQKIRQFHHYLG